MVNCPKCSQTLSRFKLMFKTNYSTIKCSHCGKVSKLRRLGGTLFGALTGGITPIFAVLLGKFFELPLAILGILILYLINIGIIFIYYEKYFEIMYE